MLSGIYINQGKNVQCFQLAFFNNKKKPVPGDFLSMDEKSLTKVFAKKMWQICKMQKLPGKYQIKDIQAIKNIRTSNFKQVRTTVVMTDSLITVLWFCFNSPGNSSFNFIFYWKAKWPVRQLCNLELALSISSNIPTNKPNISRC